MTIDSHQHFWQVGRFSYPWMTDDVPALRRDFLPRDLMPELAAAGVTQTIVVQASPTATETDFLLALAHEHDFIAGVVGWPDLEADFPAQLEKCAADPKLVGLRPAVEFESDDRWLLRPRVVEHLRLLAQHNLPLDLIVWPRHLRTVLELLDRVPTLRCVVDHLAKPDITHEVWQPSADELAAIAEHPNVWCKLSGLLTPGGPPAGRRNLVRRYLQHAWRIFGPDRVMFGSDWPVSTLASSYVDTLSVLRESLADELDATATAKLFGGNCAAFYGLKGNVDAASQA